MNFTFTITAKTTISPCITFSHSTSLDNCFTLHEILIDAFNSIEIICDQTGEVVFNHYLSAEYYTETSSISDVLSLAKGMASLLE